MATIYEILRVLSAYGWRQSGRAGDVRILTHPRKPGVNMLLRGALDQVIDDKTLATLLAEGGLDEVGQ